MVNFSGASARVKLRYKAGKSAADLARGREIAAVFNQDEKAVSTELLVCHIQPPYFHLNGRCVINRVRVHVAATEVTRRIYQASNGDSKRKGNGHQTGYIVSVDRTRKHRARHGCNQSTKHNKGRRGTKLNGHVSHEDLWRIVRGEPVVTDVQ